jgi:UDP-glucose 4-epimerase
MTKVLVTGGAGYIGSHTIVSLLMGGYDVVVLDNLSNSKIESLHQVEKITSINPYMIEGDVRDTSVLNAIFDTHQISAVFHFAGKKSVAESVNQPIDYFNNNVFGTISLCNCMAQHGVYNLVFSSSATVYGKSLIAPVSENMPVGNVTNPYGLSKYVAERMLGDLAKADPRWSIALLRYFNPIGAHESSLIGEDPNGRPENLLPFITQVAIGKYPELVVYGGDYATSDGTGVRDYIHVVDLAEGHIKALEYLEKNKGVHVWNLGTGRGYSVIEIIRAFERASSIQIPYRIADRRAGDLDICYADPSKAEKELSWKAIKSLDEMMIDSWRWQYLNPHGYMS